MTGGRRAGATEGAGARRIDETMLVQLVADLGADAVSEVCDVFLADARELLGALRTACDSADTAAVARGAHRLRSASGFLGAETVSTACGRIERLAREDRLDGMDDRLTFVGEELEQLSDQLGAAIRRLGSDPQGVHP